MLLYSYYCTLSLKFFELGKLSSDLIVPRNPQFPHNQQMFWIIRSVDYENLQAENMETKQEEIQDAEKQYQNYEKDLANLKSDAEQAKVALQEYDSNSSQIERPDHSAELKSLQAKIRTCQSQVISSSTLWPDRVRLMFALL